MLILGIFSFLNDPMHALSVGFHSIMLWLDAIVYEFVSRIYNIFILLAETNIFEQDFYRNFSQRIYAVLGVVMLFVLAYALLQALVDPDKLTKGDKGIGKMVPTFVTSLVIIGLLPTIFDFAYNVQNFILEENTIGVLVLGTSVANSDTDVGDGGAVIRKGFGTRLAYTALHTFLNQENELCGEDEGFNGITCAEMEEKISSNASNFMIILNMADAIADGDVVYRWFFSTAVGLFLIYVIATFCLDLAVRAARLAFLQLIAPVPVLMRVLPTKNDIFKNWLKKTMSSFSEVFVRVFIMYMAIYFISNFKLNWSGADGLTGALANILIIMGILMFVKEFPKLLSEVTGIDSGNIKLGIKDFMGKLGAGGVFAAGGILGAGVTTLARNTLHAGQNIKDAKGFKGKAAAFGRGIGSVLTGGISGAVRGGMAASSAKNFSDMRNAAGKGAKGATDSRDRREAYRAAHQNDFGGVAGAHISDMFKGAKEWAQGGFEAEEARIKYYNDVLAARDKSKKEAQSMMEKNTSNIDLMTQAGARADWRNGADALFREMRDAQGNQMSLDAIRKYVSAYEKEKVELQAGETIDSDTYQTRVRDHQARAAQYQDMLNQLEKATWQTIEGAAVDSALASSINMEGKLTGIKKELDDINNLRKSHGESSLDASVNNGKTFGDEITRIENERNVKSADLEQKKRDRESRRQNRSGSGGNS